ncbi:uncharacterized protein LOC144447274 [Glandiceps talaboti]
MDVVGAHLSKVLLITVLWCKVGDTLLCKSCETTPTCDPKTKSCLTCDNTVTCSDDDLCMVTWWIDDTTESEAFASYQCFPAKFSPGIYGSRCEATKKEGALTCLCNTDNCNKVVYLPDGILPEFKEENETAVTYDYGNGSSPMEMYPTTENGDNNTTTQTISSMETNFIVAITLSVTIPLVVFGILVTVISCVHKQKLRKLRQKIEEHQEFRKGSASHDMRSYVDFTFESESKIGMGENIQMSDFTVSDSTDADSNQNLTIQLQALVSQGQFAKIWKGTLAKDGFQRSVAVKIFPAHEYKSWTQETDLYTDISVCLQHPNILEFIGSEERTRGSLKQYWLVTAFQEQGSVRDYLCKNIISWNELCTLGKTLFAGAAYMHSYAVGQDYLPKIPVAHRDIKSANVLIKIDGTCAISDFGLALKLDPSISINELANSGQVGTPRYMAPEALDSKVNLNDIESFKQCDMYALALVLWEMLSRCSILADVGDYQLPFSNRVRNNPTIELMKGVLLRDKYRPDIPPSWTEHKGMRVLVDTMVDCWDDDPEARLTASCVESRICNLSRLDDADFDIFTEDTRLLDDFDSGMASSVSQVTSSHDSTSLSSPNHSPHKVPRNSKKSITSLDFSDESGMYKPDIASPSHRNRYNSARGYMKSVNSDITEENEIIELASDDDLPTFPESIDISFG